MSIMNGHTILIVDDEANIRLMLRTALKSEGYRVTEAANGREALDEIERNGADAMILDLSMPLLDGMGVLRELNAGRLKFKPRIIVLTAYGSIPAAVNATRLGAMDFLEKPVSPQELRECVKSVLTEPLPSSAPPGDDALSGGYAAVLDRVRKALRLAKYTDAETLLMKAADLSLKDAAYFNLLGVLYESRHQWRLARKFYGKAMSADKHYQPPQKNMRRLQELQQFGRTHEPVTLGDELDILFARLPDEP